MSKVATAAEPCREPWPAADKKNQVLEADAAVIVEQQRRIRQQIEQLDRDQPSLSILQQRKAELESDLSKYHKVIELLRSKNAKLSATQSQQTAELEHASTAAHALHLGMHTEALGEQAGSLSHGSRRCRGRIFPALCALQPKRSTRYGPRKRSSRLLLRTRS